MSTAHSSPAPWCSGSSGVPPSILVEDRHCSKPTCRVGIAGCLVVVCGCAEAGAAEALLGLVGFGSAGPSSTLMHAPGRRGMRPSIPNPHTRSTLVPRYLSNYLGPTYTQTFRLLVLSDLVQPYPARCWWDRWGGGMMMGFCTKEYRATSWLLT